MNSVSKYRENKLSKYRENKLVGTASNTHYET